MNLNFPCRVCLETAVPFANIFKHKRNGKTFSEMLMDCAPITIKEYDGLPCNICSDCIEKLIALWNFREKILNTEAKLRRKYCTMPTDMLIVKEEPTVNIPNINPADGIIQLKFPRQLIKTEKILYVPSLSHKPKANVIKKENLDISDNYVHQTKPLLDHDYLKDVEDTIKFGDYKKNQEEPELKTVDEIQKVVINGENNCDAIYENIRVTDMQLLENQQQNNFEENSFNENNIFVPPVILPTTLPPVRDVVPPEIIHKHRTIFCKACDKSFSYRYYHNVHVAYHVSKLRITCDICHKPFIKQYQLNAHKKIHSNEKFPCDICGKMLKTEQSLAVHKRIHITGKPYTCNLCEKAYTEERQLKLHILRHNGEKNSMCELCGKSFGSDHILKIHLLSHNTERTVPCPTCGKLFTSKRRLQVHCRRHTNKRPHVCELCGKAFKLKQEIRRHVLVHFDNPMGGKVHSCRICGKVFRDSSSIPRHMLTHTGETPYSCNKCPYSCRYKQQFDRHMRKHK